MPNVIDSNGLTIASLPELVANLTAALQGIYGADINVDPDSPDGQRINIFCQAVEDALELIQQVNAMFDPDQAIGVILDQRVAINGIQRQEGTFSTINVTITTTQALTLPGLDQTLVPAYTVADNAGNQWALVTTQNPSGAGSGTYLFEAVLPGAVSSLPNTITVPVSIVLGVSTINNAAGVITLGNQEETDAALRVRRQASVSLSSQGYLASLNAALLNTSGVTYAKIYENNTGTTIATGILTGLPGHSIWVIVSGTATADDIANAIYQKRNAGAGMFGSITHLVTQVDGSQFPISWDVVSTQNLAIKMTLSSLDGINSPYFAGVLQKLPIIFTPGVQQEVNINGLATLVQEIDPNSLVTLSGFSTSVLGVYTNTLSPTTAKNQFVVTDAFMTILVSLVATAGITKYSLIPLPGAITYTMAYGTNASGGSLNNSTGVYSAGATPGTDIINVTDTLGNTVVVTVVVS